jgi:hypothetical protein
LTVRVRPFLARQTNVPTFGRTNVTASQRPRENAFRAGVTNEEVLAAVEISGFPLQLEVGALLRELLRGTTAVPGFVQDEWTYIDGETGQLRSLDLHAITWLEAPTPERHAQPQLALLVECKRSDFPFVFFPATNVWLPDFPAVVGMRHDLIQLSVSGLPSPFPVTVATALGLQKTPLLPAPAHAITLSHATREGKKKVVLTGTLYNETVLPLIKGLDYFRASERPKNDLSYFECIATLLICVVDAPMVMAVPGGDLTELRFENWVRLIRDVPRPVAEGESTMRRHRPYAIDYVHRRYLATYVSDHVLAFGDLFRDRVKKHWATLSSGAGTAQGIGDAEIEPSLRPLLRDDGPPR